MTDISKRLLDRSQSGGTLVPCAQARDRNP